MAGPGNSRTLATLALAVVAVVACSPSAHALATSAEASATAHVVAWETLEAHEHPGDGEFHSRRLQAIAAVGDLVKIRVQEVFNHLVSSRNASSRLAFPMPDAENATTVLCDLVESELAMPAKLAAKFPDVHVWQGTCDDGSIVDLVGQEGEADSVSISFHGPRSSASIYVDSAASASSSYVVYNTRKARISTEHLKEHRCQVDNETMFVDPDFAAQMIDVDETPTTISADGASLRATDVDADGASITTRATNTGSSAATVGRKLKLALIANKKYSAKHNNKVAKVLTAMLSIVSRMNSVYLRELGVYFQLVDNNDELICAGTQIDSECDALPNNGNILYYNGDFINSRGIKMSDYDIGHSFTTGSGGVAGLGVVCQSWKFFGTTGLSNPVGDYFAIDYVSHEMGHQMGMGHVFRDCRGQNGNLYEPAAVEAGSGATIMSYAGLCGSSNIQGSAMPTFNSISLQAARKLLKSRSSCGTKISTGRRSPVVTVPATCTVPAGQSFMLEGSSDSSGGSSVYQWSRSDLGSENYLDDDVGRFRPWEPTASKIRYFPNLYFSLNNINTRLERLPTSATSMTLRFHERVLYDEDGTLDSFDSGLIGDFGYAETEVKFVNTTPLSVTSSGTFQQGSSYTFRWKVGGTKSLSSNVAIYMALDGLPQGSVDDFDYSDHIVDPDWVLVTTASNKGSVTATVPATIHSESSPQNGLLMIRSEGDEGCAFYDIKRITISGTGDTDDSDDTDDTDEDPSSTPKEECYDQGVREEVKKANKVRYIRRVNDVETCVDACLDDEDCVLFTYNSRRNGCWLLSHSINSNGNAPNRWYSGTKADCAGR